MGSCHISWIAAGCRAPQFAQPACHGTCHSPLKSVQISAQAGRGTWQAPAVMVGCPEHASAASSPGNGARPHPGKGLGSQQRPLQRQCTRCQHLQPVTNQLVEGDVKERLLHIIARCLQWRMGGSNLLHRCHALGAASCLGKAAATFHPYGSKAMGAQRICV